MSCWYLSDLVKFPQSCANAALLLQRMLCKDFPSASISMVLISLFFCPQSFTLSPCLDKLKLLSLLPHQAIELGGDRRQEENI